MSLFNGTGLELGDDDTNEAFPSLQVHIAINYLQAIIAC